MQSNQVQGKKKSIVSNQKFIVIIVALVLYLFFFEMSQGFQKYTTLLSMLDYSYYIILLSIGVLFPLVTGGVDLSIGTGMICYSLTGGYLIRFMGFPCWAGILVSVLFGVIIGLMNGTLVSLMSLPPFLATLCSCMITRGLGAVIVGGKGITWPDQYSSEAWFRGIFKYSLPEKLKLNIPFPTRGASGWSWKLEWSISKLPIGLIWIILIIIIMSYVLKHTRMGRYTIAIGSNKEAARLSGVNVKFYHVMVYVISGLFAGLASIAYSSIFPTVQPGEGAGFELDAIGGAILGGVSASGGAGTITGAFLGVIVISLLKTGLPYIGLQANWQQIITGAVLIGAVIIDLLKGKKLKG